MNEIYTLAILSWTNYRHLRGCVVEFGKKMSNYVFPGFDAEQSLLKNFENLRKNFGKGSASLIIKSRITESI